MPKITPRGVYKVHADAEAYEQAMSVQDDEEYVAQELGSLVLVEALVEDVVGLFDEGLLKQPHTEYVAYAPTYLDKDTAAVLAEGYETPQQNTFVIVFYLHFYEPSEPLATPYGPVSLPAVTEMPERLAWKEYTYWD